MHGYQIMIKICDKFGVKFGSSTIYPALKNLEKKSYVKVNKSVEGIKLKKVYVITKDGQMILDFAKETLIMMTQRVVQNSEIYT